MEVLTVIIGITTILGTVFAGLQWLHSQKKTSIHPLYTSQKKEECQIRLAPDLHDIPAVMNGGRFEGNFANFQIRFGSETDLELVDAILLHKATAVVSEDAQKNQENEEFTLIGLNGFVTITENFSEMLHFAINSHKIPQKYYHYMRSFILTRKRCLF